MTYLLHEGIKRENPEPWYSVQRIPLKSILPDVPDHQSSAFALWILFPSWDIFEIRLCLWRGENVLIKVNWSLAEKLGKSFLGDAYVFVTYFDLAKLQSFSIYIFLWISSCQLSVFSASRTFYIICYAALIYPSTSSRIFVLTRATHSKQLWNWD